MSQRAMIRYIGAAWILSRSREGLPDSGCHLGWPAH